MQNNFFPYTPLDPSGPYTPDPKMTGEDYETSMRLGCLSQLITAIIIIIIMAFLSLFSGCTTTKVVTVERVKHDTLNVTVHQRDSIYMRDSIYVHEYAHGDTVYLETERWHTRYQDRWLHDSIYISRRESVPVPYPVEKRVPAELNWFQQMRLWLGNIVLLVLAMLAGWWLLKKKLPWLPFGK